jgi:hypothetical protein
MRAGSVPLEMRSGSAKLSRHVTKARIRKKRLDRHRSLLRLTAAAEMRQMFHATTLRPSRGHGLGQPVVRNQRGSMVGESFRQWIHHRQLSRNRSSCDRSWKRHLLRQNRCNRGFYRLQRELRPEGRHFLPWRHARFFEAETKPMDWIRDPTS